MAKTDPDAREARVDALADPLLAALEAAVQIITDVRKGRKTLAVVKTYVRTPDGTITEEHWALRALAADPGLGGALD